jgi:hypothetical protein
VVGGTFGKLPFLITNTSNFLLYLLVDRLGGGLGRHIGFGRGVLV